MKQLIGLVCLIGILPIWKLGSSFIFGLDTQKSGKENVIRFPVDDYSDAKVSQEFGAYLGLYGDPPKDYNGYHGGEDIAFKVGTSVYPIAKGKVAYLSNLEELGYLVAIEHEGSFIIPAKSETVTGKTYQYPREIVSRIYSVYVHIKPKFSLRKGDPVEPSEPLGTITKTTLRAHLHFEIRHPDQKPSNSWVFVGYEENWSKFPGTNINTGYYKDPQKMVNAGLRDPSDFIKANMKPSVPPNVEWKEYKLGNLYFALPTDWKISFGSHEANQIFLGEKIHFVASVLELPKDEYYKGAESGKWSIIYSDLYGGKIEEEGSTDKKLYVGSGVNKRLTGSLEKDIAGYSVTVCLVKEQTQKEWLSRKFALIKNGKVYVFDLSTYASVFPEQIFDQLVFRIRFAR